MKMMMTSIAGITVQRASIMLSPWVWRAISSGRFRKRRIAVRSTASTPKRITAEITNRETASDLVSSACGVSGRRMEGAASAGTVHNAASRRVAAAGVTNATARARRREYGRLVPFLSCPCPCEKRSNPVRPVAPIRVVRPPRSLSVDARPGKDGGRPPSGWDGTPQWATNTGTLA